MSHGSASRPAGVTRGAFAGGQTAADAALATLDIAGYARDPARERAVLAEYGYRHGWERFWGTGSGPVTGRKT